MSYYGLDCIKTFSILSVLALLLLSVPTFAQDLIIKQPIAIEPLKSDPIISQPRVEPPPPQPVAPLAKEPMIVSVQPDQAVQPAKPPAPRDFIQADPAGAPPRDPRAAVSRPLVKTIKEGIASSSQAIDKFQSGQTPPPRFESTADFKKWAASLPPEKRQLLVDRVKQMRVPSSPPVEALPKKRLNGAVATPDDVPAKPKIQQQGQDQRLAPPKVAPSDVVKVPFKDAQVPVDSKEKGPRPDDSVGKDPIDRGLVEERPRKGKLAEIVLGNPEVIRKKESPEMEKQLREPRPEKLKEVIYERLKVPKEDRKKAIELKKEALRLEKEGKKDEARKKEKAAEDLLPKVRVKSKKEELKPIKDIKDKRPDLAREVKGKLNPDVRVEKRALRIEYKDSALDQTEFVYSVEPPKGGLSSFELVVEIPKEVAKSVKDIDFRVQPDQVIKDDPVVKWMLKNIPQDKVAEYSFTVDGDVQNFDTLAVAAGDRPSVPQRIVNWFLDLFGLFD